MLVSLVQFANNPYLLPHASIVVAMMGCKVQVRNFSVQFVHKVVNVWIGRIRGFRRALVREGGHLTLGAILQ